MKEWEVTLKLRCYNYLKFEKFCNEYDVDPNEEQEVYDVISMLIEKIPGITVG